MIKITNSWLVAAVALFSLAGSLPMAEADIPGITLVDNVDPLPGADVYVLRQFALNHNTHKLYVAGAAESGHDPSLRIINTISRSVIGGVDLGRYAGAVNGFNVLGLGVDESAAPVGNKIYVVGGSNTPNAMLRVIDGATDMNLTGEGTDVPLPIDDSSAGSAYAGMTVNSANHKIYVANFFGEIVVVDGPNRQVLTTIPPNGSSFYGSMIANPVTNKVFIANRAASGMIDGVTDTFTPLSLPFYSNNAVVNPDNGHVYFTGAQPDQGVYVVDGNTGQLITSRPLPDTRSVTFDPTGNTVYVGTGTSILALDGTDLSSKGSFPQSAFQLTSDFATPNGLFILRDYNFWSADELQNMIGALDPATGVFQRIAVGYRPFDLAINSRTNRVYVTDEQTSELLVLDGTNHAVVSRIPVTYSFYQRRLAVSERLNRIYLSGAAEDSMHVMHPVIDIFDGATNQFLRSIALDGVSEFVAVDDTRRQIYVAWSRPIMSLRREIRFRVYDADTEAPVTTTISLGEAINGGVSGLAANPVTGRVYISTSFGIVIVDGNTNTIIGGVNLVKGPIAINRRTNKIYVAKTYANSVAVINGVTDSLETTFSNTTQNNDDSVDALAVDEVTNRVYVADAATQEPSHRGRMTAFDANNNYQFLGQIDLGLKPVGIALNQASRQLFVSNNLDGVISVLEDATSAPADLFGNISTRAYVADGDNVLIGGFILDGPISETKRLLLRAIGPTLTQLGVPGALPDTTLEVHLGAGIVTSNDNWKINDLTGASQQAEIEATGIPPASDLESALVLTLPAGQSVTAIVRGKNGVAGVGLVEVYDLDRGLPATLANISTRGQVGSGDNVMIAGVITLGSKSAQVVLRAIGPSLAGSGVANPLEDPVLELRDTNGGLITSNDDWQEHEAEVNAALLAPADPRESAIVATLYPANYTAIARGKNGATGVALVEAYYLTASP